MDTIRLRFHIGPPWLDFPEFLLKLHEEVKEVDEVFDLMFAQAYYGETGFDENYRTDLQDEVFDVIQTCVTFLSSLEDKEHIKEALARHNRKIFLRKSEEEE
jgi:hypothetical protein